jgi:hypothetical protein
MGVDSVPILHPRCTCGDRPLATLSREYFKRLFIDRDFMLALPHKRIQFIKEGEITSKCNFETAFFCYGLAKSGVCFLEDKTTHVLG